MYKPGYTHTVAPANIRTPESPQVFISASEGFWFRACREDKDSPSTSPLQSGARRPALRLSLALSTWSRARRVAGVLWRRRRESSLEVTAVPRVRLSSTFRPAEAIRRGEERANVSPRCTDGKIKRTVSPCRRNDCSSLLCNRAGVRGSQVRSAALGVLKCPCATHPQLLPAAACVCVCMNGSFGWKRDVIAFWLGYTTHPNSGNTRERRWYKLTYPKWEI